MAMLIQLCLYLFVGFIEMFFVTWRTSFIAKNKKLAASSVVFIENLLSFVIIYQLVSNLDGNWPVFIAYSTGGSLGTFVNLKRGV